MTDQSPPDPFISMCDQALGICNRYLSDGHIYTEARATLNKAAGDIAVIMAVYVKEQKP